MSKLSELIKELCSLPAGRQANGVEYKRLGDIATSIYRGSGIKRDEVTEQGIPCVRYGEIYTTYDIWFDKCVSHTVLENISSPKYFEHGDILFAITGESVEDIAKSTAYVGNEKCLAGGDIVVLKHEQDPKYLSYVLSSSDLRKQKSSGKVKSKVVHSSIPAIEALVLPVPPLEIQREIVQILDNFTNLTAELTAELTARKRQYEFYRDKLLTCDRYAAAVCTDSTNIRSLQEKYGYVIVKLGEVANYSRERIHSSKLNKNNYVGVENLLPYKAGKTTASTFPISGNAIKFLKNDILIGNIRPYLRKIWFSDCEGGTNGDVLAIHTDNEFINPRFLYHVLASENFFIHDIANSKGAKMPRGNKELVMDYSFCLPPLAEQNRIVSILDRFDKLCNDLTEGLPAEIEARKKQYEYYRDKLLSFEALS